MIGAVTAESNEDILVTSFRRGITRKGVATKLVYQKSRQYPLNCLLNLDDFRYKMHLVDIMILSRSARPAWFTTHHFVNINWST